MLLRQPSWLALSAVTPPPSIPNLRPHLPLPLNLVFVLLLSLFIPSICSLFSHLLCILLSFHVILSPLLCLSCASRRAICRGRGVVQERDDTRVTGNHGNTCSLSKCRPHQCWIASITASLSALFPSFFQPFFLCLSSLFTHVTSLPKKKKKNRLFLPALIHLSVPHLTS